MSTKLQNKGEKIEKADGLAEPQIKMREGVDSDTQGRTRGTQEPGEMCG